MVATKDSDNAFFALLFVCFVVFSAEVVINSIVIDGYKFSFFFWLEILAAVSLIPDIDWLINPIQGLFGIQESQYAADAVPANAAGDSSLTDGAYNALSSFRFLPLDLFPLFNTQLCLRKLV